METKLYEIFEGYTTLVDAPGVCVVKYVASLQNCSVSDSKIRPNCDIFDLL